MKRKLDSKYEDLVKYVNAQKDGVELMDILKRFYEKTSDCTSEEYSFITTICSGFRWAATRDSLVPIITDIYNDNYELEEPECYWKFNELKGFNKCDLYFGITVDYFGITLDTELLLIDVATRGTAKKCTKSELNDYLLDTNLTTDNFTPTEVLN